jgi:hypothetical protein
MAAWHVLQATMWLSRGGTCLLKQDMDAARIKRVLRVSTKSVRKWRTLTRGR